MQGGMLIPTILSPASSSSDKEAPINQSVKLSGSLANGMYLVNIKSATVNQVFHFVLEQ
jgi:hypothetical protein